MLLGIDLGASSLKIALRQPAGAIEHEACAAGHGRPQAALAHLLDTIPPGLVSVSDPIHVAVTGSGHALAGRLPCLVVNEVIASARGVGEVWPEARTVIDLGGQFSKWVRLAGDRDRPGSVADFATNGLCAAGAGAFLEQQASRLGLSVEALGQLAARAARGASIAGRCSVFAKSDMIHLQQKGTPAADIAYGLCLALARTFLATIAQGRAMAAPIVLIGGGACNPGLVRAFGDLLDLGEDRLIAPREPRLFGARGAALMAVASAPTSLFEVRRACAAAVVSGADGRSAQGAPSPSTEEAPCRLDRAAPLTRVPPSDPTARVERSGDGALPPLERSAVASPVAEDPEPIDGPVRAYLGIDVGSVSTNLVLIDPALSLLQGVYLPTRGRPIEVLQEGLDLIAGRFGDRLTIIGVGTTGSGRYLAGKLVGADAIHNEITAQLVSALSVAPDADTIFEIGGQDSKYISVRDGRLADFEMNKICAGGTGSFLEEQAERLGIRIVDEFAALALRAERPCDLGARCTVFMDTELVRAQERGASLPDICAGLAYAVARNYLEKVVGGRPVGRVILFQGGTASNAAVVQAFRRLLGREVRVHPYNRISGAIGAARLAARAGPSRTAFLGWRACADVRPRSFECHRCENRCQVSRIQIGARAVHFGDACDRYSERDRAAAPAARPFPELFAARDALMEGYSARRGSSGPARVGLLRASLNLEFLPLWSTFLRELGFEPVVSARTTAALLQEHASGLPGEMCLPIKTAAAHARALLTAGALERIFVPAVLECPPRGTADQSHTCFYGQQLADMLRVELGDRVIACQFSLGRGLLSLVSPALALAQALDRSVDAVLRALRRANAVHEQFTSERQRLGEAALAARFDRAVVVLGRPYNTHDTFLSLALARHLDRLGLAAIPWDLLPLDSVQLDERWRTVPWHYNREQLRAIEIIRTDRRLFPILVSSYGCGPDGFIVKHLEELLAERPRLLLEFDEHRGEAGLVTRLEAFADEIDEHLRARDSARAAGARTPGARALPAGRRFFVPNFAQHAHVYAAALRASGHEAEVLAPPDEATVRLGERHASGRECHPFAILGGEMIRLLRETDVRRGDVFFVPNCTAPCLLQQYGDAYRLLLHHHGAPELEVWEATTGQIGEIIGFKGLMLLYEGLLATDILFVLGSRLRPYQRDRRAFDARLARRFERVAEAVASRRAVEAELAAGARDLWQSPRSGAPGSRPVVGVTGDLYTRVNPIGNADLFNRLEAMGVEVWPSPYFATMSDLAAALELPYRVETGMIRAAAFDGLAEAVTGRVRQRFVQGLPADVVPLALEPPARDLIRLARPFVGPRTNHLIVVIAAKTADFLRRGATGVVSAASLNCMVGTAAAALVPALRAAFDAAPIISVVYGGAEGPAQRIRLETFVEQVRERWRGRRHSARRASVEAG
jgi:predicted CoA-substrate-specific enzyme activase